MRNLALAAIAWFQLSMGVLTAAAQTSPRDEPKAAALLVSMEVDEVAAFDAEYGRLIVQKLTKAITDAAQPACVADNNLTPERLQGLVRDLLLVGSSTLKEFYSRARDETILEAIVDAKLGANAKRTFLMFRDKLVVKQLFDKLLPGRFDHWVDHSSTTLARYFVLDRFKLKSWHPQETGDQVEMSRSGTIGPTTQAAMQQAQHAQDADTLKTFMSIYIGLLQADEQAKQREVVLKEAPHAFYRKPEFQDRFRALCISRM